MTKEKHVSAASQQVIDYLLAHYEYRPEGKIYSKMFKRVVSGFVIRKGYLSLKVNRIQVRYSRAVWALNHGAWPHGFIDHINGIVTDNRIENLRDASIKENNNNKVAKWKPNKDTGLPGVYHHNKSFYGLFIKGKRFFNLSKYGNFHTGILLGRRYKM